MNARREIGKELLLCMRAERLGSSCCCECAHKEIAMEMQRLSERSCRNYRERSCETIEKGAAETIEKGVAKLSGKELRNYRERSCRNYLIMTPMISISYFIFLTDQKS